MSVFQDKIIFGILTF